MKRGIIATTAEHQTAIGYSRPVTGPAAPANLPPISEIPEPDPDQVVELKSKVGKIFVERSAHILTDSLVEHGYWDPQISRLIRMLLRRGMTFVDAGANIGYFTLLASKIVGRSGRVYAIEPDIKNLAILKANIERNGAKNVTILPMAAWTERTQLYIERPEAEGATTQVSAQKREVERLVEAARLDETIAGPVDYLKVDCESTDHVVVNSARGLLESNPKMAVTVEFDPHHDSHTGHSPAQILDQYEALGLSPYELSPQGDFIEPSSWERIATKPMPEGHTCFDFLLARELPEEARVGREARAKGILERGGDLLEYVPEAIRPPIRDRDRQGG
jgi:FkbM family methyltransferase